MDIFSTLCTRRAFVQASTAGVLARKGDRRRHAPTVVTNVVSTAVRETGRGAVDPALVRTLAMKAMDAARSAGATYADVRLTRTIRERLDVSWTSEDWHKNDSENLALGVRALVNGYWGFAATPYWTADEAVRVATAAVTYATINAKGPPRPIEFGNIPVVTGEWATPIKIDPFRISIEEKLDDLRATAMAVRHMLPHRDRSGADIDLHGVSIAATCMRQEQSLATTDGSYITQTLYQSGGSLPVFRDIIATFARGLLLAGRGWEMWAEANVVEQLPRMLAELEVRSGIPVKPVEVGRYDVVCDATTIAGLLDATLGRATEVDRALGYEANASGTSYLGPDPLTCLGNVVANEMVSVTANRSFPAGVATVRWDAEGVTPEDFTLVKAGTLVDYQTTREQAHWLAPWYARAGTPPRSHGCAGAEDALQITMQRTPNLALTPVAGTGTFDNFVSGLTDGIVVERGVVRTDFQCKNGEIAVTLPQDASFIFRVKDGKRVACLNNASLLFNATEFWKNITALGSAASVEHIPGQETKGEPSQETSHTVSAVPAVIKGMTVIDRTRKA